MANTEVTASVAHAPGPFSPLDTPFEWVRYANYPNYWAAHIVAGLLENEGVPTYMEASGLFEDMLCFSTVWVPHSLAHRARWVLAQLPPTELELIFLATGELPANSSA